MYCILKDIEFIPRCPVCHNLLYLRDWVKGFQQFCSRTCINRYQTTDEWKKTTVVKANKTKAEKPHHNKVLDEMGYKNYRKDPNNPNFFLVYNPCEHYRNSELRIGYTQLLNLQKHNAETICPDCIKKIYDEYQPEESEIKSFRFYFKEFITEHKIESSNEQMWSTFYPRQKKIIDLYYESVSGKLNDSVWSERVTCFKKGVKKISNTEVYSSHSDNDTFGFLRETEELAVKSRIDPDTKIHRTGLLTYLLTIFPDTVESDWIHDAVVEGIASKRRPDYRNEKLKLIVEFDGVHHYMSEKNIESDMRGISEYEAAGYKVVRIPYFIQLSNDAVKELFGVVVDKKLFDDNIPSFGRHTTLDRICDAGLKRLAAEFKRFPKQYEVNIAALENAGVSSDALEKLKKYYEETK